MNIIPSLKTIIESARNETWAIVYAFNSPHTPRTNWYDRWKYDVINDYVEAVSLIGAEPYIIDVDQYISISAKFDKKIDFVINLNSGATPISNLGLIPSLSEWNNIACFPNSSDVILTGERKDICKSVFSNWFNVPQEISLEEAKSGKRGFIIKPLDMGNSRGIRREIDDLCSTNKTLIEEFIRGYEVTIPVIYDFRKRDYVVCPPVVLYPNTDHPREWFYSYDEKFKANTKVEYKMHEENSDINQLLIEASRFFKFQTIARFDFRWDTFDPEISCITPDKLFFLEINCLPTMRTNEEIFISLRKHYKSPDFSEIWELMGRNGRPHDDIYMLSCMLAQARGDSMTR